MMVRSLTLSILLAAASMLCLGPLRAAVSIGVHDDRYVQIIAAPVLLAILVFWDRERIFEKVEWDRAFGIPLFALACAAIIVVRSSFHGSETEGATLAIFALILAWIAAFIVCFGLRSFRMAFFPLGCLLLMIPVPAWVMDRLTAALQHASAAVSYEFLRLAGVPVYAQQTRMYLPNLTIDVAPECSGIRSCLALGLVSLVVARICLHYEWHRVMLVAATIPVAILKNALRISVIVSLSEYVNRAFLNSPIHHYGGIVFAPVEIALFVVMLGALRRSEALIVRRGQVFREQSLLARL